MHTRISVFLISALVLSTLTGCGSAAGQVSAAITPEEAQSIALEHAGLTADQATRLHTQPDRDDGILHYDVEFHSGGYEYDYEIDANSGNILKSEKERQ